MRIETVDPAHPYGDAIHEAARILRAGGLVAFPTETVYGLGANALDEDAIQKIFTTKGRPSFNPLIVHVGTTEAAQALVTRWPDAAGYLASRFWPGPLTIVLPKRSLIPDLVTAGLQTVAVRVPHHPVALSLLRTADVPVAAPSANPYTRISPTTAEHVRLGLGSGVDLILDGGATPVGIESTVVDMTGDRPRLLRPGTISREDLESVVGSIASPEPQLDEAAARPAPGMVRQHYSPRGELRLFYEHQRDSMAAMVRKFAAEGEKVGGLLFRALDAADAPLEHTVLMPDEPGAYAARLYSALHEFDAHGCTLIVADAVPERSEWAGVRDRLARAAHND